MCVFRSCSFFTGCDRGVAQNRNGFRGVSSGVSRFYFFPHKSELIHKLNDVGFGFFVPLFFIHVGSTLDLKLVFLNPHLIPSKGY